ncbi:MAG: YcnI family protein [Chloroflexi bacterium]|nr:YcnI family protein [Chloroflexota bacterium]
MSSTKRVRISGIVLGLAGVVALGLSVASAHVTVWPRESTVGAFERYTVRVPTERAVPTVKVEVEMPPGVTFSKLAPKPGWSYEIRKDAAGRVTAIAWSGGALGPDEFDEFLFQARNPREAGRIAWRALQTYADGSVVEWTGPEGSERPASVTEVKAAPAPAATDHPEPAGTVTVQPSAATPPTTSPDVVGIALPVSLAALLLAAGTLVFSLATARRTG